MKDLLLLAMLACSATASEPGKDFAGNWRMDPARSESAHQDVPAKTSTIAISSGTGKLSIETMRDDAGSATPFRERLEFNLDGSESTSTGNGNVPVTGKARWEGAKLIVETVRNIQDSTVTTVTAYTLNPGGNEMTIDKTLTVQHGYMGRSAPTVGHGKDVFVRTAK